MTPVTRQETITIYNGKQTYYTLTMLTIEEINNTLLKINITKNYRAYPTATTLKNLGMIS